MNNILTHFKPLKKDSSSYESLISKYSLDKPLNLLWYHSAGDDFRILDYFNFRSRLSHKPDLYIFTDYGDWLIKKISKNGIIFSNNNKKITIENIAELKPEMKITDYFHPMYNRRSTLFYREQKFPVYLLDLKVETRGENSYSVPLLYLIWEDTAFLKAFVLERNVKIKYFQKPREYGFGGCWTRMVFLLYYLGIMNTKYLFLESNENYRYEPEKNLAIIQRDKLMKEKFMDEKNHIPLLKLQDIVMQSNRYGPPESYNLFLVSEPGRETYKTLSPEDKFYQITRTLRI